MGDIEPKLKTLSLKQTPLSSLKKFIYILHVLCLVGDIEPKLKTLSLKQTSPLLAEKVYLHSACSVSYLPNIDGGLV